MNVSNAAVQAWLPLLQNGQLSADQLGDGVGLLDRAANLGRRFLVQAELHQIVGNDQFRCARSRLEVSIWIFGAANADVAKGIDHAFIGQNAVCNHKVVQIAQFHGQAPATQLSLLSYKLRRANRQLCIESAHAPTCGCAGAQAELRDDRPRNQNHAGDSGVTRSEPQSDRSVRSFVAAQFDNHSGDRLGLWAMLTKLGNSQTDEKQHLRVFGEL
jgi:hypothetical protein